MSQSVTITCDPRAATWGLFEYYVVTLDGGVRIRSPEAMTPTEILDEAHRRGLRGLKRDALRFWAQAA